jgi:acetolactate synthase-1/2/3 large subunit
MKASDYIVSQLYERGVSHLFEVAGGMITHLLDSADRHGRIYLVSVHHEQAAAFAAHGMAFVTGVPGVAMATSGPGAVNLLTGIGGCYFDSVPAIFLTGQVNLAEQKGTRPIRQLGFQETDIISMAGPVTKAALMARSARAVPGLLDRAFEVALSGRPGPVLLDLPMDVQRSDVPVASRPRSHASSAPADEAGAIDTILSALNTARKPLILAGGGINAARAAATFRQLADVLNVPVVNSLMAVDVLPSGHRLRVGLIGTYGNRWANLALSECDTLIVLGSRLDVRQTGSDTAFLQSGRTIIQVDCDEAEIGSRVRVDRPVVADLRSLLPQLLQAVPGTTFPRYDAWKRRIRNLRRRWPDVGETPAGTGLNPNEIMHELSQVSTEAAAYVVDTGNHQMWAAQ